MKKTAALLTLIVAAWSLAAWALHQLETLKAGASIVAGS